MEDNDLFDHPVLRVLAADEPLHAYAKLGEHLVLVTDRRMAVAAGERLLLDVPIENIRRIQFDIERTRPATLVIVPERPTDEPQVLAVPPSDYQAVANALVLIGLRLAEIDPAGSESSEAKA